MTKRKLKEAHFFAVESHREASDQKFKRNEGETANQLRKAIAVADSNCAQWFTPHLSRSLPMRTVIPADEHAEENVRVDVICRGTQFVVNNITNTFSINNDKY